MEAEKTKLRKRHKMTAINETLKILLAFLRRDFLNDISYRLAFMLDAVGIFMTVFLWFFISKFVGKEVVLPGAEATLDYFSYVLVGFAAMSYLHTALQSFSRSLRTEQLTGTLEALLSTPVKIPTLIIGSVLWSFVMTTIHVVLYIAIAGLFFGMPIKLAGIFGFLIALALTVAVASSLGVLSASFIIVFKRGDPINYLISGMSALFGGVFFPPEVFPPALKFLSKFVPMTYSLNIMRGTLLLGVPLGDMLLDIAILAAFCVVLLPASVFAFRYALDIARRNGTLVQY